MTAGPHDTPDARLWDDDATRAWNDDICAAAGRDSFADEVQNAFLAKHIRASLIPLIGTPIPEDLTRYQKVIERELYRAGDAGVLPKRNYVVSLAARDGAIHVVIRDREVTD